MSNQRGPAKVTIETQCTLRLLQSPRINGSGIAELTSLQSKGSFKPRLGYRGHWALDNLSE